MAGVTIIPINRAQVCTPTFYSGGGGAVPGYPLENVVDPTPTHQTRITPNGGAGGDVLIQFRMPAQPAVSGSNGDPDFAVSGLYIGNHNIDGLSFEFRGNTTANYAGATSMFVATLDNFCGQANLLKTFSPYSFEYWFLKIAGSTLSPTRIGCIAFGPAFDLGAYMRPGMFTPRAQTSRGSSMRGHDLPGRIEGPVVARSYQFKNPTFLTQNLTTSRAKGAGNYVAYNTLNRAFSDDYQISLNSGAARTRTGVCAGSGYPMPYHEGDMKGVSSCGRPAQLAIMEAEIPEFWASSFTGINLSMRDVIPRGAEVRPNNN